MLVFELLWILLLKVKKADQLISPVTSLYVLLQSVNQLLALV